MNRIVTWLCEEAAAEERRRDPVPTDRTLEGRLRREFREARAHMIREAVHCVRVLAHAAPTEVARLAGFLDDPTDELVIELLDAFGAWRAADVLSQRSGSSVWDWSRSGGDAPNDETRINRGRRT